MDSLKDQYLPRTFLLKLSPYNYYNSAQKIIRVEYSSSLEDTKYFEFYNLDDTRIPHPSKCCAIVETSYFVLNSETYCIRPGDDRYTLKPGYRPVYSEDQDEPIDDIGELDITSIPYGFVKKLIPLNAVVDVSSNPDADTAMSLGGMSDPSDPNNVQISLHAMTRESYTKPLEEMDEDPKYDSYGLSIGDDFLQLRGLLDSGITMGPNGKMAFSGDFHFSKSKGTAGFQQDNPLGEWIPSSIVTAIPAMLKFPFNMDAIASLATMAQKMSKTMKSVSKLKDLVNR